MEYTINKKFETSVVRSDRVLNVAESFGIGLGGKDFVVFDDFKIDVNSGDVVYINGQSGSGKSVLLRELKREMQKDGMNVGDIDNVEIDPDKPLIDQIGENTTDAINILSKAGINDAYLMIRRVSELSDGQRYRLKLAKLMESDADVWIADEFGAVLDRVTAKVVAYNAQKLARSLGKTLIVATTHTDLVEELGPNVIVQKRFNDRVELSRIQD